MTDILNIHDLTVSMTNGEQRFTVLQHVDLCIKRGEIRAIVGESGCGKSTLANSIIGFLPAGAVIESGSIRLADTELLSCTAEEMRMIRAEKIGVVFQDPFSALDPVCTVYQLFRAILTVRKRYTRAEITEKAAAALHGAGIKDPGTILTRYPHELSGGLRQRVLIAMALVNEPDLLIADEPTTALDVTIQKEILTLLRRLARERGLSVLFITHSLDVAAEIADTISVFYGGRIAEEGKISDIFAYPIHPYTQALLKTIPSLSFGKEERRLMPIEGELFSFLDQQEGCPFAPRCPYAREICYHTYPVTKAIGDHTYTCIMENQL